MIGVTMSTDEFHEALRLVYQFEDYAKLCSCGDPELFWKNIFWHLEQYKRDGKFAEPDYIEKHYVMVHVLDSWDLTEHGGSVYGAWISESGVRLLNALKVILMANVENWHDEESWWDRENELYPDGRDPAAHFVSVGEWKL